MSAQRVLLHVCCAPDATVPWADLPGEGFDVVPYWYGNNIHPAEEEKRRREALGALSLRMGGDVLWDEYMPGAWLKVVSHLADEPEGGGDAPSVSAFSLKRQPGELRRWRFLCCVQP